MFISDAGRIVKHSKCEFVFVPAGADVRWYAPEGAEWNVVPFSENDISSVVFHYECGEASPTRRDVNEINQFCAWLRTQRLSKRVTEDCLRYYLS